MKMIKLLIFGFSLIVLAWSAPINDVHHDRFLFCIEGDALIEKPVIENGIAKFNIKELDDLLNSFSPISIEQWLPNARSEDRDGEVLLTNIYEIQFDRETKLLDDMISEVAKTTGVLYAEHSNIHRLDYNPNDPRIGYQWFLDRIEAKSTWDLWDIENSVQPGNREIVLASVDTGVQYTHPDLANSMWINKDEIPLNLHAAIDTNGDSFITPAELIAYVGDADGNGTANLQDAVSSNSNLTTGTDTDGNGYNDDIIGWDIAGVTSGTSDSDNDPMASITGPAYIDNRMHGTHVAGLLAATTDNGVGIASVIFNGSVMPVKCLYDQDTYGYVSGGYNGILYAAHAGANIINCSWGGTGWGYSEQSTINNVFDNYGAVIVAAAGNGNDDGTPSGTAHYPSGYDNVVSVTAVGSSDAFHWANYGDGEGNPNFFGVDISAPGENIQSTVFTTQGSYSSWPGTSMASPIVASAFGLLMSKNPSATQDWLINTILESTDNIDDINPGYIGQLGTGRLNVYNAIARSVFPSISYTSYSMEIINDNGDGQLTPGEEVKLRVTLMNQTGWMSAENATGYLSCDNPYVTITDSIGAYGTVSSGNVGVNLFDRYQFNVSSEAPAADIEFTLRIEANMESENPYIVAFNFIIPISLWQLNFPIELSQSVVTGNAVIDINGDGINEIIFGGQDSLLHAIQVDGTELANFPIAFNGKFDATPAIGDVDNNGDLEIVIGNKNGELYIIQSDGSYESIWTASGYLQATPTLYDFDSDGDLEIVALGWDYEVAVMHHDGTMLSGYPLTLSGERMSKGGAVGDIDGDGSAEIIFGTWGYKLHALSNSGEELAGFPVSLPNRIISEVSLGNIDNSLDNKLEILVGCDDDYVYAVDYSGATLWSYSNSSQNIRTSPGIADINNDGFLEIFFGSYDRFIYGLDYQGNVLPGYPVETGSYILSSPTFADLNNDGSDELFVGSNDGAIMGLNNDGSSVSGFPISTGYKVQGTPTMFDFDGDGDIELVVGNDSSLIVADISSAASIQTSWFTHQANYYRTGLYNSGIIVGIDKSIYKSEGFELGFAYPNPFNPSTNIQYRLSVKTNIRLSVYDLTGREIAVLENNTKLPGQYSATWYGQNSLNENVSSGVYLLKLESDDAISTQKVVLLR